MKGKNSPLTRLNILLTCITPTPSITRRIVRMDLGGETGLNPDVQALLERHGNVSQPTGAGALSQNGSGERTHHMILNAVRAMLHSASLPPKYWEYALYVFLRIHTDLHHGTNTVSPYHKAAKNPADLSCHQAPYGQGEPRQHCPGHFYWLWRVHKDVYLPQENKMMAH
jgi:hypothetical protein